MLSAANLAALDEAGVGFIVGSRMTRAPVDLAAHFRFHGDVLADGQIIDTITPRRGGRCAERDENLRDEPVWDPATHPGSWRAVWVYSAKRFARDSKTLTAQESRARAVVAGRRRPRGTRFVTTHRGDQVVDEAALARARRMAGLKGYVSNIPAGVMGADEVIASYHELWHVEQSFRMTRARPENPPDLPPHPRRDRGPPDRRDGLPGRRPPPATGHRDEHQATRPRTQTTSRGHHQRQRPPPHRPTPTHRNRTANPQQSGSGALNWHGSGTCPTCWPRPARATASNWCCWPCAPASCAWTRSWRSRPRARPAGRARRRIRRRRPRREDPAPAPARRRRRLTAGARPPSSPPRIRPARPASPPPPRPARPGPRPDPPPRPARARAPPRS